MKRRRHSSSSSDWWQREEEAPPLHKLAYSDSFLKQFFWKEGQFKVVRQQGIGAILKNELKTMFVNEFLPYIKLKLL